MTRCSNRCPPWGNSRPLQLAALQFLALAMHMAARGNRIGGKGNWRKIGGQPEVREFCLVETHQESVK
jgi:hypothetical protein